MYIFSQDKVRFVNTDKVIGFGIIQLDTEWWIKADDYVLGRFSNLIDAKKTLDEIFNQIIAGAKSYQVS